VDASRPIDMELRVRVVDFEKRWVPGISYAPDTGGRYYQVVRVRVELSTGDGELVDVLFTGAVVEDDESLTLEKDDVLRLAFDLRELMANRAIEGEIE
jgi:hypothetical protein